MKAYDHLVLVFAALFVALGVAILIRTAGEGGGIGYLIGVLFVALGIGRVYLRRR